MRPRFQLFSLLLCGYLALVLAACSNGDSGPSCSFDDPSTFATNSPWPKFRHDLANTGAIALDAEAFAVLTSAADSKQARVFPAGGVKGPFSASPIISDDGSIVYIGSNDGQFYAIRTSDWTENTDFNMVASQPIVATGLLARRNNTDAIYFGTADGRMIAVDDTAMGQGNFWPFGNGLTLDKAPSLGTDGTIYTGSTGGLFFGICPNGVLLFAIGLGDVSPVAIAPDDTIFIGADDSQLRAFRYDGLPRWTFSASQAISAAPVLELSGDTVNAIYTADTGGRVFKVNANGVPISGFQFAAAAAIQSSPALAGGFLYFGSDDGNIHAISSTTGAEAPGWPIHTNARVISSPAVATSGSERVIVVGSNDGGLYFIHDSGSATPSVARYAIDSVVRSSPAIDFNGTVYVGADDGRVYAVGNTGA